ncbi:MAG: hypothetical protein LBR69_03590 [Endomicrobium sp.]|jgi:hypothetical protein|nr:hypothetical protein [Endomicrobium sp.]
MNPFRKIILRLIHKKLDRDFKHAKVITYGRKDKFVIMSDLHRGTADSADNFYKNRLIYKFAIKNYLKNDYDYIELGDADELWKNKNQKHIFDQYGDIFWTIKQFYARGKLHMVYGNHDIVKSNPKWLEKHYSDIFSIDENSYVPAFKGLKCYPSVILKPEDESLETFYLTHGHQSELTGDLFWRVSRFFIRHVWRPLESIGLKEPAGTAEKRLKMQREENTLIGYARQESKVLIAAHIHRPFIGKYYNNSGSCISEGYIDALEIEDGKLSLVKWRTEVSEEGVIQIKRKPVKTRTETALAPNAASLRFFDKKDA